jgi:hypothetical protein
MDIIKAARNAFVLPTSETSRASMIVTRTKAALIPGGLMNFIHTLDIGK